MRTHRLSRPFEVVLSEKADGKVPDWVQIMKAGKFDHPEYGEFEITPATLSEMKANFDNRVRRVDLAVDYFHENDKLAAGWFSEVQIRDGNSLWARIEWTEKARQALASRELRYFSPEWAQEYTDAETKQVFRNVLFGGGLTNRPFLKEMQPIVNNEQGDKMTLDEVKKELDATKKKLSETEAKVTDAEKKAADMVPEMDSKDKMIEELKAKIAELEGKLQSQMGEMQKLAEAKKLSDKEAAFTKLLTEGKAVPAQKDAYLSGDMIAFAEKAKPLNLSASGNGQEGEQNTGDKTQDEIYALAEAHKKANPTMNFGDCVSHVKKELKKAKGA